MLLENELRSVARTQAINKQRDRTLDDRLRLREQGVRVWIYQLNGAHSSYTS